MDALERVAHRGGSALAPENTMAAFRNALRLSVDAIEFDVQMSKDGHAIVFHDNTVQRLTDGTGNILDLDFAYLRSLNAAARFAGGWSQPERIPLSREVLELARGQARVYLEIKTGKRGEVQENYPQIVETVVDEIRSADMISQTLVIAFDWSLLRRVKELEPAIQTGALASTQMWSSLSSPALETLVTLVTSLGCQWVNMDCRSFSEEMPSVLHQRGLKLGLWTVNTLEDLRRFAAAGVDSLTTDHPDLFARL
ncbi:MAG: hypothetical protein J2P37_25285 [Ktedonobacteraceae bacterium]|nr:hypothetical protein [Ktedonobacteraceae bacterium]MBO0789911.1 hypothetical protein [Ktedonobacteraceae bacterium]